MPMEEGAQLGIHFHRELRVVQAQAVHDVVRPRRLEFAKEKAAILGRSFGCHAARLDQVNVGGHPGQRLRTEKF